MWMNDDPPEPSEFNGHHYKSPFTVTHPWRPGSGWILDGDLEDVWIVKVLPNYLAIVEFRDGYRTCIDWRRLWCDCMAE